jgi:hypothetical protein
LASSRSAFELLRAKTLISSAAPPTAEEWAELQKQANEILDGALRGAALSSETLRSILITRHVARCRLHHPVVRFLRIIAAAVLAQAVFLIMDALYEYKNEFNPGTAFGVGVIIGPLIIGCISRGIDDVRNFFRGREGK